MIDTAPPAPPSSRVVPHAVGPAGRPYDAEDDPHLWSRLATEFLRYLSHMVLGDAPIRLRTGDPRTILVPGGRGWHVRGRSVLVLLRSFTFLWATRQRASGGAAFGGRRPYTMTITLRYRLLDAIERHLRQMREVGHE